LFEKPTKNDVFFSAASCKKDIIFGGHLKQIFGPSYFARALAVRRNCTGRSSKGMSGGAVKRLDQEEQ
jgi:hypothetical protein